MLLSLSALLPCSEKQTLQNEHAGLKPLAAEGLRAQRWALLVQLPLRSCCQVEGLTLVLCLLPAAVAPIAPKRAKDPHYLKDVAVAEERPRRQLRPP